jgi:tetratricopeptide (TPR) repeat protein
MNTDIGELFSRIKVGDPKSVIGVVVLLLGLAASLWGLTTWLSASSDRASMESQFELTTSSIEQIKRLRDTGPEGLRSQLAEIDAQLAALRADFPTSEQTRLQVSGYYAVASQFAAQVTRLESVLPPTPQGNGAPYTLERYAIEAQGEFPNLLRFMSSITQSAYKTYSFDNLALTHGSPAVANVNLTIFAADTPQALRAPSLGLHPAASAPVLTAAAAAEADRLQSVVQGAMAAGDWPVAIAYGQRVLAIDPGRADVVDLVVKAYVEYARQLALSGQAEQGRQHLTAALALRPGDPQLLAEIGMLGRR